MKFYDLESKECSQKEWFIVHDSMKRFITQGRVKNLYVSTVFLGIEHSLGAGKLNIFETMVFDDLGSEIKFFRYDTIEEARKGHEKVVEDIREGAEELPYLRIF
tara:strand:- start:639 stop:950 length:312 start_codon:yes stop_codon:yes gene_type:complete